MKRSFVILAVFLMIVFFAIPGNAADYRTLTILAYGTVGANYMQASGIVSILYKYLPGVRASVQPSGGDIEMVDLVIREQADFAFLLLNSGYQAYNGLPPFDEAFDELRIFLVGSPSWIWCVVPADSPIESFYDLKGKTVSVGAGGSSCAKLMVPTILEAYGLSFEDINEYYLGTDETVTGLKDGTLDVGFFYQGIPSPAIMDLTTSKRVRFLSLGEEQRAWIQEKSDMPFVFEKVPAGIYTDVIVGEPATLIGIPCVIITRENVDADLIYNVAKVLDEHIDEWAEVHPGAAEYTPEMTADNIVIPLHPGMEKYLKDTGRLK